MPDQNDTRRVITARRVVRGRGLGYATSTAIADLFDGAATDTIDLSTIRVTLDVAADPQTTDTAVSVTARLEDPDECPSCHAHAGHPHTDYCRWIPGDPDPRARLSALLPPLDCQHEEVDAAGICRGCGIDRARARSNHHQPCPCRDCTPPPTCTCGAGPTTPRGMHTHPCPVSTTRWCTDPTCPVTNAHHHDGDDVVTDNARTHAPQPWCLATRTLGITPHTCLLPPGHEGGHAWVPTT